MGGPVDSEEFVECFMRVQSQSRTNDIYGWDNVVIAAFEELWNVFYELRIRNDFEWYCQLFQGFYRHSLTFAELSLLQVRVSSLIYNEMAVKATKKILGNCLLREYPFCQYMWFLLDFITRGPV